MINTENKKKKYYILVILILAILAVLILPNLIISSIQNVTKNVAKQLENDNDSYSIEQLYTIPTVQKQDGTIEVRSYHLQDIAYDPNRILYCIEHGQDIKGLAGTIPLATAMDYGYIEVPGREKMWPRRYIATQGLWRNDIRWSQILNRTGRNPLNTYAVLRCTGNHYDVVQPGAKYYPEAGYILTYPDINEVTQDKQDALWMTPLNHSNRRPASNAIYDEAVHYKEFHNKTTNNGQNLGTPNNPDIKITNETEKDADGNYKVVSYIDTNANTITFGPYSIDYIYGAYDNDNLAFGGISDMYMIGYNSNGEIIKEKVEIKHYIDPAGNAHELEFFEPNEQDQSYIDRSKQVYPKGISGGEDKFYVVVENPNDGVTEAANYVTNMGLHIEFKWMAVTNAMVCDTDPYVYRINFREDTTSDPGYCIGYSSLLAIRVQDHISLLSGRRCLYKAEININPNLDDEDNLLMQLGGYVWEDVPQGKESLADGKRTDTDRMLPNVKVTLYTEDGEIATLLKDPNEDGISEAEMMTRINPTYTNSEGYYLFDGLDPMKKYYVQFEYNGQVYLPTDYERNLAVYNTEAWEITSKGTETPADRDSYNQNFEEIGSAPANYRVPSESVQVAPLENGYNEAFSQYDLMGFEMTENGDYRQGTRLIDGFYKIEGGNIVETEEIQEGEISKAIKEYVKQNKKAPTDEDMIRIYQQVAGGNEELLKKVQFIEDTYIKSYTQAQGAEHDLYPVYDAFVINNKKEEEIPIGDVLTLYYNNVEAETIGGVEYKPLYPGQYYINQGLWRRQEPDLALRKDIAYAATRINGKTEVYEYNPREEQDGYWQIQLRMRDYNNYYQGNHEAKLYAADYNYRSDLTNRAGQDKELQLYVTYKITVRNASQSIVSQITEIVDYYDKDYTFREDLSWLMYQQTSGGSLDDLLFTTDDYQNTIDKLSLQGSISTNNRGIQSSTTSQYESRSPKCKSDVTANYNDIYIRGLANKKLESGDEAYIYLTFQVNRDGDKPVIVDDDNSMKQNYVEINGYKTYYRDGTSLPNGVSKGSTDAAGLIDINSTPGNLCQRDLQGNRYEKNFENDTDRAKSIKVVVKQDYIRSVNGMVWEDQRTMDIAGAIIGDGIRQDNEILINGVTVELVERLEDGNEYVWQSAKTQADGKYEFKTNEAGQLYIIPGNYFVRFRYGDSKDTVNLKSNGGLNETSYNGQDFKSTIYQKDMNNGEEAGGYTGERVDGYTGEYYDFAQMDSFNARGKRFSDAKDDWQRRQQIINYSKENVTNEKAEILASPYTGEDTTELIANTSMTAQTALMVLQGEYNRTNSQADSEQNGQYTVNSVDFGITERPKAVLEINKTVTNLKITLANGNILFDSNGRTTDLLWTRGTPYDLINEGREYGRYKPYYNTSHRYAYRNDVDAIVASKYGNNGGNGLIVATMDEELMQGATVQITYLLTVTNAGEIDYEEEAFYYKGTSANTIATTKADTVVDYIANNLTYKQDDNRGNGWQKVDNAVTTLGLKSQGEIVTNIAKYNTIIKTDEINAQLQPGQNDTASLVVTQLLSPENSADDKTYDNIAEITSISNSVGRRMAFSIQGNQDPTKIPEEIDSAKAERVTILPPFGIGNIVVYIAIATAALAILTIGIIFIKKKVLTK